MLIRKTNIASTIHCFILHLALTTFFKHEDRSDMFCKVSDSLENSVQSGVESGAVREPVLHEEEQQSAVVGTG